MRIQHKNEEENDVLLKQMLLNMNVQTQYSLVYLKNKSWYKWFYSILNIYSDKNINSQTSQCYT